MGEGIVGPSVVIEDGAELVVCGWMTQAYFCLGVNRVGFFEERMFCNQTIELRLVQAASYSTA